MLLCLRGARQAGVDPRQSSPDLTRFHHRGDYLIRVTTAQQALQFFVMSRVERPV